MREIKFKFVKDNKIVYEDLESLYKSEDWTEEQTFLWFVNEIMNGSGFSNIKKIQFTGIKDKNDKEIYEGDILNLLNKGVFSIKFKNGMYGFKYKKYGHFPLSEFKYFEVIGNSYENPELLEEKDGK